MAAAFLLFFLLLPSARAVTLTIGVVNSSTSPCAFLLNESFDAPGAVLNFVPVNVSEVKDLSSELAQLRRIADLNLQAVLAEAELSQTRLFSELQLPHLMVPMALLPQHSLTPFGFIVRFLPDYQDEALLALLQNVKAYKKVFLLYSNSSEQYLEDMLRSFNNIEITGLSIGSNFSEDALLIQLMRTESMIEGLDQSELVFIPLILSPDFDNAVPNLLKAAMTAGLMNKNQLWIFPEFHLDPNFLLPYRFTNTRLVTFQMAELGSSRTFEGAIRVACSKAVRHLVKAAKSNNRNLTAAVIDLQNELVRSQVHFIGPTKKVAGALEHLGTWERTSENATTIMLDDRLSRKVVIRVGVVLKIPYYFYDLSGEIVGYSVDLFQAVAKPLHATIKWVVVTNPDEGVKNASTGEWSGLMGMLVRGEIDVIGQPIILNEDRRKVATVQTLLTSGVVNVRRTPKRRIEWFFHINPFSILSWIMLGIVLVLNSAFFYLMDILSPNGHGRVVMVRDDMGRLVPRLPRKRCGCCEQGLSFLEVLFYIFTTVIIAKLDLQPRRFSARIYMLFLWFFGFCLVTLYTGNLTGFLLQNSRRDPFAEVHLKRFENIVDIFWENTDDLFSRIINSSNAQTALVRDFALKQTSRSLLEPNFTTALERMRADDTQQLITQSVLAKYYQSRYCDLISGPHKLIVDKMGLVYLENRTLSERLKVSFKHLKKSSQFARLEATYFGFSTCQKSQRVIDEFDLCGIFCLLVGGILLGFFFSLCEWLQPCLRNNYAQLKLPKLLSGRTYQAQVIRIEEKGVWVKINKRPHKYFLQNTQLHREYNKSLTAKQLRIKMGDFFNVKYFGNDPVTKTKRFMKEDAL